MLKQITFLMVALLMGTTMSLNAQEDKSERKSPPVQVSDSFGDVTLTIDYSSPSVNGREIYGKLVAYNKVWRTGANEATTFEVSSDVLVEGQKLAAGKYALFTIPGEEEWKIILNSQADQWGAYNRSADKDVLTVSVKPGATKALVEKMTINIATKGDQAAYVSIEWENTSVGFAVEKQK